MWIKLVTGVLVLGVAALVAWFLAGPKPAGPTDLQAPPGADQSADAGTTNATSGTESPNEVPREPASPSLAAKEGTSGSDELMAETPEAKQEAYVAARVAELQDLGMENDPASLDTILSELDNADPGIRLAAVDAAVQFGSRDAIPRLTTAAAQASDPKEKSAILDAIEFLSMPTLAEALAQKNSNAPAASASSRPDR
jgi:hypothetical protein